MWRGKSTRTAPPIRWRLALALLASGLAVRIASGQENPAPENPEPENSARHELETLGSEVELGLLYNSDDSNAFGDYTGLANDGFFVLGNGVFHLDAPWDDPDPTYLDLRALNLGLDSRQADAEWGQRGRWGGSFVFDQIPKYWNEKGRIPFFKQGDSAFVLPPGWVPGQNAAGMPLLDSSLHDVDSRSMRRIFGGGLSGVLRENLEASASYEHQEKWGHLYQGAAFGVSGGNPRAVALPERIDQTTHNWETALRWAADALQLDLQYQGSRYVDHTGSVTWENPYLANASWSPNAGFPPSAPCFGAPGCGLGRKDQPPDNWWNQLIASGGYALPWWNTRVTANAAFGWMTQDDSFLPFSVNSTLAAPIPVPRNSLDGRIDTTLINFQVDSHPLERLRLDLRYRFDDRDNQTPRNTYVYIRNDSEDQTAIDSSQARVNRPYSYRQQHVDFEAGYELFRRTELTLGYDWTQTWRDFQEVRDVWENGLSARLWTRPWSWLSGRVHYRHGWRNNSDYNGVAPIYSGFSQQFLAGFDPATGFDNLPLLRKFYLAAAQRDELASLFTLTPIETVAIGVNVNWYHDDFDETQVGLTERDGVTAGIDVSWSPVERLTTNVFYDYEKFTSDQIGWSFNDIPTSQDPARQWQGSDKDRAHTVGTGCHVDLLPGRLGLDTQYLFSIVDGFIHVNPGPALAAAFPYPKERTRIHDVSVRLEYQLNERIAMRLGYLYERMSTRDWALDGVQPGGLNCSANACVIDSGQASPDANNHLVTWSMVYRFEP
jgi:MtrB/PioB family decaheme-associated outer membrane protein